MRKQTKGFTIIELLVVIGAMVIATPFIMTWIKSANEKTQATEYADHTKIYAVAFTDAIRFNYQKYYDNAVKSPNTTQVLKYSDIVNAGFAQNIKANNFYNQTPCVAMTYNQTNKELNAVMFFTDGKKAKQLTKRLGAKARQTYGEAAGYYYDGAVTGSNSWSLPNPNDLINSSNANACDNSTISNYGLVINLNMQDTFPKITDTANYLSRVRDDAANPNAESNSNTMQTDILMQDSKKQNAVFFTGNATQDGSVALASTKSTAALSQRNKTNYNHNTNGVVVTNGAILANSLGSGKAESVFTYCAPEEIGTIVQQEEDMLQTPIRGQLQCTYNPLQCQNPSNPNDSHTCYLPASDISIRYHPNKSPFLCTIGFIDPSVTAEAVADQTQRPSDYTAECYICYKRIFWTDCYWEKQNYNSCTWSPSNTMITNIEKKTTPDKRYTIWQGVSAITTWKTHSNPSDKNCRCNRDPQEFPGIITSATCTTSNPVIDSN